MNKVSIHQMIAIIDLPLCAQYSIRYRGESEVYKLILPTKANLNCVPKLLLQVKRGENFVPSLAQEMSPAWQMRV